MNRSKTLAALVAAVASFGLLTAAAPASAATKATAKKHAVKHHKHAKAHKSVAAK